VQARAPQGAVSADDRSRTARRRLAHPPRSGSAIGDWTVAPGVDVALGVGEFQTARLRARPVTVWDQAVFERLWADEQVACTLGGVRHSADVRANLAASVEHWSRHRFGRWLLHDDGQAVGTVKLARCEIAGKPEVELGYALFPACWGAGYATEAAVGALAYGRDVVGLLEVVAFALTSNRASLAVMQRLGFRYEMDLELPAGPHALYRLDLRTAR